jgi:tRNA A37 methylthiotransferase MiaB
VIIAAPMHCLGSGGPQRSRPPDAVLDEIRTRLSEGYREVVLTGVHIGAYARYGPARRSLRAGGGR